MSLTNYSQFVKFSSSNTACISIKTASYLHICILQCSGHSVMKFHNWLIVPPRYQHLYINSAINDQCMLANMHVVVIKVRNLLIIRSSVSYQLSE